VTTPKKDCWTRAREYLEADGVEVRDITFKGGPVRVRVIGGFTHKHIARCCRIVKRPVKGVWYHHYFNIQGYPAYNPEAGTEVVFEREVI